MPYRPIDNQNRVEYIKRKFENSINEDNKTGSFKYKHPNGNLKKNHLLKTDSLDGIKNDGKALIKRTPAFRREKLGSSKSLSKIPYPNSQKEDVAQKKKEETLVESIKKELERSKTDTNLFKYCDSRNSSTARNLNTQTTGGTIENTHPESEKILQQYSVVDKTKKKNNNETELKLSESIRRALQSPLPKGPPPKKPPRTFCHTPQSSNISKPSPPKADIPKLKSKLEKLENVIKTHKLGTNIPIPKIDSKIELSKIPEKQETGSSVPDKKIDNQSCMFFTSCLSQNKNAHVYEKLLKKNSEFYLDVESKSLECNMKDNLKESSNGTKCGGITVKRSVSEPIYDLPCISRKSKFETFGKGDKNEVIKNKKTEEGLHYMCTDVVKKVPVFPRYSGSFDNKKSLEGENWMGKLEGTTVSGRLISSKMSCQKNVHELVNNLKISSENEKKSNIANELAYKRLDSSEESDCDSVPSSKNDNNSPSAITKDQDSNQVSEKNFKTEEELAQMTAKRKIYVSRVSSMLFKQTPYWKRINRNDYTHLFECCMLVGLTLCENKKNVPYIKSIFPSEVKPPPMIEFLCFPDASHWPPSSENQEPEEQYYSLVVTNENGERKFGYCRRVLPEGGHFCLPLTYCIVSPHRASGFYYKVLEELESRHGSPGVENFIKQLYESPFPGPGERLKLKEILEEATRTSPLSTEYISSTLLRRPCDLRLEEKDLTQLLQHLNLSVFLKVFSSLLHERKILLLSNSIRKLSSCIEGFHSILLPFLWQHTYIPVLPGHLIEMCEAPTPYVIGLLKSKNVEESLANLNFEDGILVDLDESKIVKCCGDEGSILPPRFIRDLKTSLNLATTATELSDSIRNVLISDAFIRFFVQVCGNYSKFILTLSNGERLFEKEDFIKSVTSNTTQSFLEWFSETAMFNSFIHERLQGEVEDVLVKLFRLRAMEYSEETMKNSTALLKNYKVINRKVKSLGDRIKDLTTFNI